MLQIPVKDTAGGVSSQIEVKETLFGVPMNQAVVHQALVRQLANARLGTSDTKTRGEVSGGGIKPRPQKHSGRSRQGSTRSPQWRHGGIVFGPHPRSYSQRMPKKMRLLALRCVLSDKLASDRLTVVERLDMTEPKTRQIEGILKALGAQKSTLLVTEKAEALLIRAAKNLQWVKTLPAPLLNVADLLKYESVIMTVPALRRAEELWAGSSPEGDKTQGAKG